MSPFQQEMYIGSWNSGRSIAILTYTSKGQSMVEAGRGIWNFRRSVIVEIRLLQALGMCKTKPYPLPTPLDWSSWRISCQSGSTWPRFVASDHLHTLPSSRSSYAARLQESLVWFWRAAEGSQGALPGGFDERSGPSMWWPQRLLTTKDAHGWNWQISFGHGQTMTTPQINTSHSLYPIIQCEKEQGENKKARY